MAHFSLEPSPEKEIDQDHLIVVASHADAVHMRGLVNDGVVVAWPGLPMHGRFKTLTMLCKPGRIAPASELVSKRELQWFEDEVVPRLVCGAKITWLAPQWELAR